jgi:hypothetical protein
MSTFPVALSTFPVAQREKWVGTLAEINVVLNGATNGPNVGTRMHMLVELAPFLHRCSSMYARTLFAQAVVLIDEAEYDLAAPLVAKHEHMVLALTGPDSLDRAWNLALYAKLLTVKLDLEAACGKYEEAIALATKLGLPNVAEKDFQPRLDKLRQVIAEIGPSPQ